MLIAAELGHVDRARTPPMFLEPEISQHAGGKRQRNEHQQNRASRNEHGTLRAKQFHDRGNNGGQRNQRDQPDGTITGPQVKGIVAAPEAAARRIEEWARELEIQFRPDAEDHTGDRPNRKRNHKAGVAHESKAKPD